MGAELAVVVTVAAIFLVPTAVGKGTQSWPSGELGQVLDGALLAALAVMTLWVAVIVLR